MSGQKTGSIAPLSALERDYYDAYDYEDCRPADDSESSDDEVQAAMRKIAGLQSRKKDAAMMDSTEQQSTAAEQTKEMIEEFENEMDADLDFQFKSAFKDKSGGNVASRSQQKQSKSTTAFEKRKQIKSVADSEKEVDPSIGLTDKATESDEEFADQEGMKESEIVDDPLYDPDADNEDEKWVQKRLAKQGGSRSDAILNCPGCMAILSIDCQQHSEYKTQYRAMFVENCFVDRSERVYIPSDTRGGRRAKKRQLNNKPPSFQASSDDSMMGKLKKNSRIPANETIPAAYVENDFFWPVQCEICRIEVGYQDNSELYHFNNVLCSRS